MLVRRRAEILGSMEPPERKTYPKVRVPSSSEHVHRKKISIEFSGFPGSGHSTTLVAAGAAGCVCKTQPFFSVQTMFTCRRAELLAPMKQSEAGNYRGPLRNGGSEHVHRKNQY